MNYLLEPFRYEKTLNLPSLLMLGIVHAILLFNMLSHDPWVMYDSGGHYPIIQAYSELRFPTLEETREFHSAPLPYLIPAGAYALSSNLGIGDTLSGAQEDSTAYFLFRYFLDSFDDVDLAIAGKIGQIQLLFVSLILFFYLAKFTKTIAPHRPDFQWFTFLVLGILPVYYRSFSFMRGEPFIAMWTVVFAYYWLKKDEENRSLFYTYGRLGLIIGLAALSRHFGSFLGLALAAALVGAGLRRTIKWEKILKGLMISGSISVVLASLFYFQYYRQNSQALLPEAGPFSQSPFTLDPGNLPPGFYYTLSLDELFVDPVRPHLFKQFIPQFYSDSFGDYWGFFLIYGWDEQGDTYTIPRVLEEHFLAARNGAGVFPPAGIETNRNSFGRYLGFVMIAALIPFALLVASFLNGLGLIRFRGKGQRSFLGAGTSSLLAWIILFNMLALLTFAILLARDDTVKATYVVQMFPAAALLAADLAVRCEGKWLNRKTITAALVLFFVFSLPTYFTHYLTWIHF